MLFFIYYFSNAPINVMPAGGWGWGGRAWGGDLTVFVVPGVGHLTDLVLPGEGIFESFFTRRWFLLIVHEIKVVILRGFHL